MSTPSTTSPIIVSGPPGSGRSFKARELASDDARWIDASEARSPDAVDALVRETLARHEGTTRVVLEDVDPSVDLVSLASRWDTLDIIATTIARGSGERVRSTEPLDDDAALAFFDEHVEDAGALAPLLRGHPQALVTAARRASVATSSMREDPWSSMLWGGSSPLQASYERAWDRLEEPDHALLEALAMLGENASADSLWAWRPFEPERLEALHATHWFERPWVLEHGARRFIEHTRDLSGAYTTLGEWLAREAVERGKAYRDEGSRRALRAFRAISPLIERALDEHWISPHTRAVVLTRCRAIMSLEWGFVRYDALVVSTLEHELPDEERALLEAYHHAYAGNRGSREAALESFERGQSSIERWSELWMRSTYTICWGSLLTRAGDLDGLERIEAVIEDAMTASDYPCAMSLHQALARLNLYARRYDDARRHAMSALSLAVQEKMGLHVDICRGWLGSVLKFQDENDEASQILEDALEGLAGDVPRLESIFKGNLALTLVSLRRFEDAIEVFAAERARALEANNLFSAPGFSVHLAYCAWAIRDFTVSNAYLDEALIELEALPNTSVHFDAYALRAAECIRTGADPRIWVERCESNERGSNMISREALRAIVGAGHYEPTNIWESMLLANMGATTTLELATKTLLIAGAPHSFARRPVAWRILVEMARASGPVDAWTLVEVGWPDEPIREGSLSRLYVTIRRLRDLGLEEHIVTTGDGYHLDGVSIREEDP